MFLEWLMARDARPKAKRLGVGPGPVSRIHDSHCGLPSGNLLQFDIEHGHLVRWFFQSKMGMFHSYVSLPEGSATFFQHTQLDHLSPAARATWPSNGSDQGMTWGNLQADRNYTHWSSKNTSPYSSLFGATKGMMFFAGSLWWSYTAQCRPSSRHPVGCSCRACGRRSSPTWKSSTWKNCPWCSCHSWTCMVSSLKIFCSEQHAATGLRDFYHSLTMHIN